MVRELTSRSIHLLAATRQPSAIRSILDSLYFSVVTFTTVCYGDLCPSTEAGKLFATFFSFGGIAIVGALLAHVGG